MANTHDACATCRRPTKSTEYTQLFFFDKHYALSALYCQRVQCSGQVAIPRAVGSICPPQEENDGEEHAAYKLMLFSRTRCPGPAACADPLAFRSLLTPSDKPDDMQLARQVRAQLQSKTQPSWTPPTGNLVKPRFAPTWKTCLCELELKAKIAMEKEMRAERSL